MCESQINAPSLEEHKKETTLSHMQKNAMFHKSPPLAFRRRKCAYNPHISWVFQITARKPISPLSKSTPGSFISFLFLCNADSNKHPSCAPLVV